MFCEKCGNELQENEKYVPNVVRPSQRRRRAKSSHRRNHQPCRSRIRRKTRQKIGRLRRRRVAAILWGAGKCDHDNIRICAEVWQNRRYYGGTYYIRWRCVYRHSKCSRRYSHCGAEWFCLCTDCDWCIGILFLPWKAGCLFRIR